MDGAWAQARAPFSFAQTPGIVCPKGGAVLTPKDTIEQTRAGFAWTIPERYNIGVDICDKTADQTPDADEAQR